MLMRPYLKGLSAFSDQLSAENIVV